MRHQRLKLSAALLSLIAAMPGAAQDRTVLPIAPQPFNGTIRENILDSSVKPATPLRAPQGAPNIFLFMSDDVGFAASSTFGGPVPTPNLERLAQRGQRYNRFHTTGICSPSRAALLTGRNHHNAGVGFLSDQPTGYPGYAGRIDPATATIAQILRLDGYNTAMIGKHHNVPTGERSAAGPFDAWPTGLGFEHFYGFIDGDADQYRPNLYRGIDLQPTPTGKPVLLDARLADEAIRYIHNQKAAAPNKPFFVYYAPGSLHAPHQAPPEYIARFKGKFDQGWDKVREESFQRQLALGIVPAGTVLTPRPEGIPAWSDLSPKARAFAIRSMEVAAAMLAYQDDQVGRVLDEIDRMGLSSNTLIAVIEGDNGPSAEVGPGGSVNEIQHITGQKEDEAWLASNTELLGGERTYATYPAGWAWALAAPLRYTKQYASMLGGIRNGMILSWPGKVARPGAVCAQFGHLVDIAPTLLAASRLPEPKSVNGVAQKPMDGESLLDSLANCQPEHPRTQYFEMTGKAGLYHDGWFASSDDGRLPWVNVPPGGTRPAADWKLYDLRKDFSQSTDVAAQNPEQLRKMIALWDAEAKKNQVYPLDHRFGFARGGSLGEPVTALEYWGKDTSLPAQGGFPLFRSFKLTADVKLSQAAASGVIVALGSRFGGWSFYLDRGRPTFTYAASTKPEDVTRVQGGSKVALGSGTVGLNFKVKGIGGKATVEIVQGGKIVASGEIPRTFITPAGLGEMLDVGRDTGVPVTDYRTPLGEIQGDISRVRFDFD